jgi:hypothetical protein
MIMENYETAEKSPNGVLNIGVLGCEEICGMGGSSKQKTSEVVCLRFKGAYVRLSRTMHRVVAYVMSQSQDAAKHDSGGASNIVVLRREESCIHSRMCHRLVDQDSRHHSCRLSTQSLRNHLQTRIIQHKINLIDYTRCIQWLHLSTSDQLGQPQLFTLTLR